jgi:glycosyltransferase involved in cell wall biosynthesis
MKVSAKSGEQTIPDISIVICSHNPRKNYLEQTLAGFVGLIDSGFSWEVVIVDNNSRPPISEWVSLQRLNQARIVVEPKQGLTAARLRGIRETESALLLFVDDDNVLATDYLEKAIQVAQKFPFLGAWGGSTIGRYENGLPEWFERFQTYIGVREIKADLWSNEDRYETTPIGAGMVVRREVAEAYAELVARSPIRQSLDRSGKGLLGCGDMDMALTACDLGMGKGVFKFLRLDHLIPPERTTHEYFLKIYEGSCLSRIVLNYIRHEIIPPHPVERNWKGRLGSLWTERNIPELKKQMQAAEDRAVKSAYEILNLGPAVR